MTSKPYKIIIADDHPVVRDGLKLIFETQTDIHAELIECVNGQEVIDAVKLNMIDLILLDISMPVLSGLEVLKSLKTELNFEGSILILTSHDNRKLILEANELGANGYILKSATADELLSAISMALDNQKYYSKEIIDILIANPSEIIQEEIKGLTPREKQILVLITKEKTNQKIAEELYISIRTVEGHRDRLLKKLNVSSSIGLVKFAVKNGLDN